MDHVVDVRVSSIPLTEKQRERLTVYLHRGATGEWDFEELATWNMSELLEWGFDEKDFSFNDIIPHFEPVELDKQGVLGKHKVITCPQCNHEFNP